MKRIFTIAIILISACVNTVHAYAPIMFNYEGVARGNDGLLLDDTKLNLRISVVDGGVAKRVLYEEIQSVRTNSLGVFNANIGRGHVLSGSMGYFAGGGNFKYIKIDIVSIGESTGPVSFECVKCNLLGRH